MNATTSSQLRRSQDRTPKEITSCTWILSCKCGEKIVRDLIPGQSAYNKTSRREFDQFYQRHRLHEKDPKAHFHQITIEKNGVVPL